MGWDVRQSACASVTQTSGVANALLPHGLFQHATPPAAKGLLSASPGTPIPAQEIQSRQIEIGSRLHLTRLCQAFCSAAGPLLLSSPHLLYRRGAQLRASDRTRPTPRPRASAATPRARQRHLHASSRLLSLRSQLNERTTSVKESAEPHSSAGGVRVSGLGREPVLSLSRLRKKG